MADITIVSGVYKPTYNWGAPPCMALNEYNILRPEMRSLAGLARGLCPTVPSTVILWIVRVDTPRQGIPGVPWLGNSQFPEANGGGKIIEWELSKHV